MLVQIIITRCFFVGGQRDQYVAGVEKLRQINQFLSEPCVLGGARCNKVLFFLYLTQKHDFDQLPAEIDSDFFADNLLRASNDEAELLRFFGAYAYVAETFLKAKSDLFYIEVPTSVPRVPISTPSFSRPELNTIQQYEEHYLDMNED
jgi:hypothetical protein